MLSSGNLAALATKPMRGARSRAMLRTTLRRGRGRCRGRRASRRSQRCTPDSELVPLEEVQRLDATLAALARSAGFLRLRIGQALEQLARRGWHHELGFASLAAYAMERCERTGRWAAESRMLARRLEMLPHLRSALRRGSVGWSMAELLARHATPDTEVELVTEACKGTVRQMRARLGEPRPDTEDDPEHHALTLTVDREEAWLFECTRLLVEQLAPGSNQDDVVHTLLAEATSTLANRLPRGMLAELVSAEDEANTLAAWRAQRQAWIDEAEAMCERRIASGTAEASERELAFDTDNAGDCSPSQVDARVRSLCGELANRDLMLGALADRFWHADGWRRLGYATATQHARERLGVSLSSLKARRALANRTDHLPALGDALQSGRVGYEAALLVSRIATRQTVQAWIARAAERTVKQLREEVEAAELFIRLGRGRNQTPPSEATLREVCEAKQQAAKQLVELADPGRPGNVDIYLRAWARHRARGACSGMPSPLGRISASQMSGGVQASAPSAAASQMSAYCEAPPATATCSLGQMSAAAPSAAQHRTVAINPFHQLWEPRACPSLPLPRGEASIGSERGFGRATLRFRVTPDTLAFWRAMATLHRRVQPWLGHRPTTLLRFLCISFWEVWGRTLDARVAYAHIYARDGFRCTSPVCTRRDVTPHHLEYRSRGGTDDDENVTSLCVWCHLHGVHEGRIVARPPASDIHWQLGREPVLFVDGRRKRQAAPHAS